MITAPQIAHRNHNTMDLPPSTPPTIRMGGEQPLGRRYAIAMEVALAIPPGKARVPRGSPGTICERYGVGPEHPTKLWENVKAQMDASQEVDLSSSKKTARPSVLTPTKVAALKSINEEYDGDILERVRQSLFKVYNQTLRTLGDNVFSVEHSGVRVRQRPGTLERVVKYDVDAVKATWDFLSDAEDG